MKTDAFPSVSLLKVSLHSSTLHGQIVTHPRRALLCLQMVEVVLRNSRSLTASMAAAQNVPGLSLMGGSFPCSHDQMAGQVCQLTSASEDDAPGSLVGGKERSSLPASRYTFSQAYSGSAEDDPFNGRPTVCHATL